MNRLMIATVAGAALLSGAAQAALVDRGGGLIYDTVRDITWLQTATGARDIDGFISTVPNNQGEFVTVGATLRYADAVAWIDQFEYTNANGATLTNWRLPRLDLIGGPDEFCTAFDGSCDRGFNATNGELSALYYGGLNNVGEFFSDGTPTGVCVNNDSFPPPLNEFFRTCTSNFSFVDALTGNVVTFENAAGLAFYEVPEGLDDLVFLFNMNTGSQDGPFTAGNSLRKAWAVHDGDIAAVIPVPAAVWLFASGLGLLGWMRRRSVS